jgi:multidrug efflux pump subunit AcrA (membrane-fusion protein)
VQLPRSALTHTGRRGEVFVATSTQSGKTFRRVDVEVLAETEDGAVVTGAISAGEEVVVSGTSALKGMGGG